MSAEMKTETATSFGKMGDYRAFYISRKGGNHYDVYLSRAIGNPALYYELLDLIRSLEQHQTMSLFINCPGGNADTAIQLVHALHETEGTVVAVLDGLVASAATFIMLACRGWHVNPMCKVMCHGWSGGYVGKVQETRSSFMFEDGYLETMVRGIYKGFLSDKEISDILEGKDIYMDAAEVKERLSAYTKYLTALMEQPKEEAKKPAKRKPRKA